MQVWPAALKKEKVNKKNTTKQKIIYFKVALVFLILVLVIVFLSVGVLVFRPNLKTTLELRQIEKELRDIEYQTVYLNFPEFIVHAAGGINGIRYSNSLEGLNNFYNQGLRWFELDVSLTADNELVIIHDWDRTLKKLFNQEPGVLTKDEFEELNSVYEITQLTFEQAIDWFKTHPDAYLVLDIKYFSNFEEMAKLIQSKADEARDQVIIQIYEFKQYSLVRELGYDKIILALYRINYKRDQILKFIEIADLLGLSIPTVYVDRDLVKQIQNKNLDLRNRQLGIATHVMNDILCREKDKELIKAFKKRGIDSFFIDF